MNQQQQQPVPGSNELPEIQNLDIEEEADIGQMDQIDGAEVMESAEEDQPLGEHPPNSEQEKPRKPLTPYLLFIQRQKRTALPGQKFSIKTASETWRTLSSQEKAIYMQMYTEQKKLYDEYVKTCAEKGMDIEKQEELDFFFPSSRIRAIMRQSPGINVKGETLLTMSKAVEYFGEHVLSVVVRNSAGKKKIQVSDLWQAINTDKILWFLRPLIDEWNKQPERSTIRPVIKPEKQKPAKITLEKQQPTHEQQQSDKPTLPQSSKKRTPSKAAVQAAQMKHQIKLTDMYPITK